MTRTQSRRYKLFKMLFQECQIEARENGDKTFFWMALAIACLALACSLTGQDPKEVLSK